MAGTRTAGLRIRLALCPMRTGPWTFPPFLYPCVPRRTDGERLQWLTLRVNQTELDIFDAAAAREYLPRATWVRQTLIRAAHGILNPPELPSR